MSVDNEVAKNEQEQASDLPFYRNPWVLAFIIGAVFITVTRPFFMEIPEPPPVIGSIGEFELVDQAGDSFVTADLEGYVYLVELTSTACGQKCERTASTLAAVGARARTAELPVRLISITTEPAEDQGPALADLAAAREAEAPSWRFASGDPEMVESVLERLAMSRAAQPEFGGVLAEDGTPEVILLDGAGGVRGFYDTTQETIVDELFHRTQHIIDED